MFEQYNDNIKVQILLWRVAAGSQKTDELSTLVGDIVKKLKTEDSNLSQAAANEYAVVLITPELVEPQMQAGAHSNYRELENIAILNASGSQDYEAIEDYASVEFDVELFPTKHDALDYAYAIGGGLGIGAQAVNTTVMQLGIGNPLWGILPPVTAIPPLIFTILDNKDKQWQESHKVGMTRFANVITGIQFAGAFFFGQVVVLQIWPSDKFTLAAKLGVPGFALLLIIPIALFEKHQALADNPRVPRRARNCVSHPASIKIFEVISQGIGADAGMSAILALVVGFQKISSLNAIIIAASVAGANMVVEVLPKEKHDVIDGLKKGTDIIRTTVKAGALGSACITLLFSIVAGTNKDHLVPDFVAPLAGGIIAAVMLPALAYRLYTYCRKPSVQKQQRLQEVCEIADSNHYQARPSFQQQPSLSQHLQRFQYSRSTDALPIRPEPKDTDTLVPKNSSIN